MAVDDVARTWCRSGERADPAARFGAESYFRDEVARKETRESRLSVSTPPDLGHDSGVWS